ncbi:MAG: hypothetical protein ACE5LH_07425 [Fidelibacterota bacterium]
MKAKIILAMGLLLFGLVGCSDFANPLSSDPTQEIQSGTNENSSGTNENSSGTNENSSGTNENS